MQGSAEFIPLQRGSLFGVRCLPVVIALKRNKFRAPRDDRRFLNGIVPAKGSPPNGWLSFMFPPS